LYAIQNDSWQKYPECGIINKFRKSISRSINSSPCPQVYLSAERNIRIRSIYEYFIIPTTVMVLCLETIMVSNKYPNAWMSG